MYTHLNNLVFVMNLLPSTKREPNQRGGCH